MAVSAKKKRKLFQVAKELNLGSHTIKEFLEKKGHPVRNPNMVISDDLYGEILQRFSHEKLAADKVHQRRQQKTIEEKPAETEVVVETKETAAVEEQTEKVPEKSEEITPEEVQPPEEQASGKSEPEKPEIVPPAEAEVEKLAEEPAEEPAEAAKEEEKTGEMAAVEEEETTPQKAEPEAEVEPELPEQEPQKEEKAPKIGDIIDDHPYARQFLERQKLEAKKKTEKKKEKGKPSKARKKKDAAAGSGKIETPVEGMVAGAEEVKKTRKKDKKKTKEQLEGERQARRKRALEIARREGKKFKSGMHVPEEDEAAEVLPKEGGSRRKRSKKKKVVDQKEVESSLKKTLAEMRDGGSGKKKRKKVKRHSETGEVIEEDVIRASEFITTQDLASLLDVPSSEIIRKCLELGLVVTINQRLDMDTIKLLSEEFGVKVEEEEEFASDFLEEFEEEESNPEDLVPRHPVVTVMGHVDHGKTSLLDFIRQTNVVAGESGGITQHIGAYEVALEDNRKITFLDTPGHEAFTAMRARGAQVTDVVVLVIAADDRVMPQTDEAIDHARAAGVPMVIAITKIDKPNADPKSIRQQLAERNLLVEDWGGKIQVADVSSKTGEGIPELLEKILLEAELLDLKGNIKRRPRGTVLEARLDKGKGPIASILIQDGILKVGDYFIVGQQWGRVRAMINERGNKLEAAGPSTPVLILGIDGVPEAGDRFLVMADEKTAREIALQRRQIKREQDFRKVHLMTLDDISRKISEGVVQELRILVKADVDGSAQALADSLLQISNDQVNVQIIRRAVGPITESDVMLAAASQAIIIGFHVRASLKAKELAEQEKVDIRLYKVIYDAIDEVKSALEGMLLPVEREVVIGTVEVRETFKVSRLGTVAGCMVLNGKITRNSRVHLVRNDVEIYDGKLSSLKRFKEDVKEVQSGYECGLMIENFNDVKIGDIVEAYEVVQEAQVLKGKNNS